VTCHTCRERFTAIAKPYARKVKCPECESAFEVPAYDPVEAEFRKKLSEPRNTDPGVYSIARETESDPAKAYTEATVTVKCPRCLSLLSPELREEAWQDTCPDCLEEYRVPARRELPGKPQPLPIPDPGQYQAAPANKPTPLNTRVYEKISDIRQIDVDPPPTWVFFSHVFQYPWTRHVWAKWVWASLAWSLSCLLVSLTLMFLLSGGIGTVVAAFLGLPAFWVVFWTLSYTSACGMTILEGTGSGQVVIDEWPEPDWREWAVNLLFLTFLGLVAQGLSVLIEPLIQFLPERWLVSLALVHVIYPVVLLSALETGSIFWPFSPPVFQSMWSHGRYWIAYYLIAGIFSAGYVTAIYYSVMASPLWSALWAGPLTTSFLFVQARLLGRLGWRVLIEPDGGKKRLRQLKKLKQIQDEPFGPVEPISPETRLK